MASPPGGEQPRCQRLDREESRRIAALRVRGPGVPAAERETAPQVGAPRSHDGRAHPVATGPAPIFFASGFITRAAFWMLGGLFGAFFLLALVGLGVPWLL